MADRDHTEKTPRTKSQTRKRGAPPYVLATAGVMVAILIAAVALRVERWTDGEPDGAELAAQRAEARWEAQERREAADPFHTKFGEFRYVHDPKGDFCFAIRSPETFAESLTRVPCTERVVRIIEGEKTPEPATLKAPVDRPAQ